MLNPHQSSVRERRLTEQRNKIKRSNKKVKLIKELTKLNHIQTDKSQLLMRDTLLFILKSL